MDERDLEKEQKQNELDQASQKTAHVAGKAAATAAGSAVGLGNVGGKAYDLASQTKVGQDIEKVAGKALQQNQITNRAMEGLNKSGALDAVDKGLDMASGDTTSALGGKGLPNIGSSSSLNNQSDNSLNNLNGDGLQEDSKDYDDVGKLLFGSKKKAKVALIVCLAPLLIILIFVVLIISSVFGPIDAASKFVRGIIDGIVDVFTKDYSELKEDYYNALKEVQLEFNEDYGVCIDVNLITATLTVNSNFDEIISDPSNNENVSGEDIENEDESVTTLDYKLMKKQVRMLAKMQIMSTTYKLDEDYKTNNEEGVYCSVTEEKIPVTSDNASIFSQVKDSSTPEKIASNDKNDWTSIFVSKVNEEENNAYFLYRPSYDEDGNCDDEYAEEKLPESEYQLSIGTYATSHESVYYWNLVNQFIGEYYDKNLSTDSVKRREQIIQIVNDIYLLYDEMGPSQTCTIAYNGPSSLCPNGITVIDSGGDAGVIDFEEYIAGVVSREAYTSEGMEALKAQAVAARTYALKRTNHCQVPISNSTGAQTFTRDINDRAREATNATRGEVLTYNGEIFSSMYDSFCYDDNDCPDARRNSDGTYTVTYTKVPNGERHTITLSDSRQYGRVTHGQGHAHGMSQLLSYQMAKEGKSYEEILKYFYSAGVEISLILSPTNTDGASIITKSVEDYLIEAGSSIAVLNQEIYTQVKKSGLGTREGVVAAATTLISAYYNKTGYKLPYELLPSGKYSGYGMDPNWGTPTGNATYTLNGLDCSGFISWAIHNGGYSYVVKNAEGWGNAGVKREWNSGTTDKTAKPGDLIFNRPRSENGTSGHIKMIIGVTDTGYTVAEAAGRNSGVRITEVSFQSNNSYYLVDMSNYYSTATKVTDYPM